MLLPWGASEIIPNLFVGDLQDASWKTAAATGALSYMEYDHVQRYAGVYRLQEKYASLQDTTIDEYLQLQSYVINGFDPKMTAADADGADREVRRTLAHLVAMDQIGAAVDQGSKAPRRSVVDRGCNARTTSAEFCADAPRSTGSSNPGIPAGVSR